MKDKRNKRNYFLAIAAAGLLLMGPMGARAALISISPASDPGGLTVGDTLEFIVSVDSIAPPADGSWFSMRMGLFRVAGPDNFNFSSCRDLSGLSEVSLSCLGNDAVWDWSAFFFSETVAGPLFSFTALFDQPGTYSIYLEQATAEFFGPGGFSSERLNIDHERDNPITISVAPVAVPEPGTLALLACGLLGWALLRRRTRVTLAARIPIR